MEYVNNGIDRLTNLLLPSEAKFKLISADSEPNQIKLTVQTRTVDGVCPDCHSNNQRVHSHAERMVKDLPISGTSVILQLQLPRFFCDNAACSRKTFTERLPGVIEPYAHRTNRLMEMQRSVGFFNRWRNGSQADPLLSITHQCRQPDPVCPHSVPSCDPYPGLFGDR